MKAANLIQRCREGEAEAVRDFVQQYENRVYYLALSMLHNAEDAGEAAQDALLAAIEGLDTFRGEAAISTWLYSITVNICHKRIRRQRSIGRLIQAILSIFSLSDQRRAQPEEAAIQNETKDALLQAVHCLEDRHRQVILLYYYADCSITEIAGILNIPEGTVSSRLFTAREYLRSKLYDQHHRLEE